MNNEIWATWYDAFLYQCEVYNVRPPKHPQALRMYADNLSPREAAYCMTVAARTNDTRPSLAEVFGWACFGIAVSLSFGAAFGFTIIFFLK